MQNARMDETQDGIKTASKNINNLICRWHHPYGRKRKVTKEPLEEVERGELKKSINSSALSFLHSATLTSYMTTGKTIALTRWTFVGHVMSLLLNMLSRLVITFLQGGKLSFNFMAAMTICSDFGAQKNKV